jgi:hypothetical protein
MKNYEKHKFHTLLHLTQAISRLNYVISLTLLYCLLDLIDSNCQLAINNGATQSVAIQRYTVLLTAWSRCEVNLSEILQSLNTYDV